MKPKQFHQKINLKELKRRKRMIKKPFLLIFSLLICCQIMVNANSLTEGDDAYSKGNYSLAIQKYEVALKNKEQGTTNITLLYNLANAHYKNKNLGKAILYWEKAKMKSPNDTYINTNLSIATDEIQGEVILIKPFFLLKWWKQLRSLFASQVWAWIGIVSLWLGITGILFWLLSSKRTLKKYGFIIGIILTIWSLFPFIWAYGQAQLESDSRRGIITVSMIQLRPTVDAPGDFNIYEGTEVEILDRIGEWSKVRLLNSDVGWVKKEEYEKI
ncbi:MAG: tetratricopeptide (TPR) repeat protein [Maribacter sp.]|jgi:tetratricopeptide (TPR) repeat protein